MAAPAPAAPAPAAPAAAPAAPVPGWKGFDTFILNAGIKSNEKDIIIYIFASTLYKCTSLLDYNLRLLNAYVYYLDAKDTTKNIKSNWNDFIKNMTNVVDINTIATMLLVLINHCTDGSGNIKMDDAYDSSKVTFITNITSATLFNVPANANSVATSIQSFLNSRIRGMENRLFNWSGFETLFVNVTDADARSYICNYFIAELNDTKALNANEDSDAYILFKQLIIENVNESHINALNTKVEKDATLINTLSKNLKYLFEYTDIATNIETKTVDDLKCFGDADIELVKILAATPAAKPIPAFDKNTLPAGWQPYNMVNIVSYNIAGLIDPNGAQKIKNVSDFLTNITAGTTPPYDKFKFRPDIITLQNTTELMADANYNTFKSDIVKNNYLVFEHEDNTKKVDKLITLIKVDYFAKSGGRTYPNDPVAGYLDTATPTHKQYYLASIIEKYKIIVINVVDTTGAEINFEAIKNTLKLDKDKTISNYDILIAGNVNIGHPELKPYDTSICNYNTTAITDSYIISTGFKDKAIYPYNFIKIGVPFQSDYSNSRPIGKRMFQDPAKAPKKATTTIVGVAVKCTALLADIATELDKLNQRDIFKLLASVSAPNTAPTAPAQAAPAAPTPPAKLAPSITMDVITEINVFAAESDGMPKATGLTGNCGNPPYVNFKSKTVDIIYDATGSKVSGKVLKKTGEERYCIDVQIPNGKGGNIQCYIHDILIDNDKVYFSDTTPPPPPPTNINITAHVTTTSSKKAPGTNINIANLKFINFSIVPGFDHTKLAVALPAGYALVTGITANISIKLEKKINVKVTQNEIYWESSNKQNFCFKVTVSGTDKFILCNITNKITTMINKKTENVKNFN